MGQYPKFKNCSACDIAYPAQKNCPLCPKPEQQRVPGKIVDLGSEPW